MIQIFLRTLKEFHQSRALIKYLSGIEETILSSMVWTPDSAFWTELNKKGFLSYSQVFPLPSPAPSSAPVTPHNLTRFYSQSPSKPMEKVSRRLFDSSSSSSSPVKENESVPSPLVVKSSPYTMFYRQLYELLGCRIALLSDRLSVHPREVFEETLWNYLLFLLETSLEQLFLSRDLDQILLAAIFSLCNATNTNTNTKTKISFVVTAPLTWPRLIQIYQTMPNARRKTLRSVYIGKEGPSPALSSSSSSLLRKGSSRLVFVWVFDVWVCLDVVGCLTPSKPAGTIHLIDGEYFGDIHSFYEEIFLPLDLLSRFLEREVRLPFPARLRCSSSSISQRKLKVKISSDHSVDYSSRVIPPHLFSDSPQLTPHPQSTQSAVLSSSIPAGSSLLFSLCHWFDLCLSGVNNTVQTTRTRTLDGKFLTTISTVSTVLEPLLGEERKENPSSLFFGQSGGRDVLSSSSTLKRSLSNQSFSNPLNSLTKKVLQIENDRQKLQEWFSTTWKNHHN